MSCTMATCCVLLLAGSAAAGDFQQANQAPSTHLASAELPALSSSGLLPRLPKINIFIGKNEIKKLLGEFTVFVRASARC